MGTNLNFKNFATDPPGDGNGIERPLGNFPLTRQTSIYSLTFDELQNTMGGSLGKDFGSMNMDELLKNIWSAEETQTIMANSASTTAPEGTTSQPGGYLQKQGSLTLPRTLSQKTVDEVWRDLYKDGTGNGSSSLPQRQQTLGEMTLEEFLVRAGVVREDAQLAAKQTSTAAVFGNTGLGIGFQQTGGGTGLMGNRISESNNQFSLQSSNLPQNVNGFRSDQTPLSRPQQPQIFPKQAMMPYATHQMPQLGSPGMRGGIGGIGDQSLNSGLVQTAALQGGAMGMVGLGAGAGAVTVATGSPANQLSSDGIAKSNGDMSSVSPVPYMFNGGLRGRRSTGAVEKVVERRQRRMIKNRESAARSRARKQAYTMELEAEVAKLKEENQDLRKKQAEIMEMQKNQVMEMMNMPKGIKKQCLRRTQTGPW
ncbi:ABSCISIC ACID-INSENSITIVE 5-like protein 5 [Morella rubra]|uniref:ABSCISIC ACID-INSENSITIVE 5-like protein 5 n=1 Tax=Morella rubra TaxID=262757 RepID=A0A6A1W981_9ROSI|nr:ABSCISIC ACID-INSENSITIVE 5-like protein 5 [Morella rubra]